MSLEFVRSNVRLMNGYAPGEQPGVGERVVKLNTNENPFPPSPKVMQAIGDVSAEALRRYPNPFGDVFRKEASGLLNLTPDMLMCGNGSDDILTILTRAFIPPGGTLAFPEPTYSLYKILAQIEDARAVGVSWKHGWQLPTDELAATQANAIYIANPNAPSGTMVAPSAISDLATKFKGAILIDEAYADFADTNCMSLVKQHANIIVSRTMSKAYSLAGLRFGYCVARADVIEELMKVKDSYNCDAISIAAATAAIADQDYAQKTWAHVRSDRARVTAELTKLGCVVLPSQANFVFAKVPDNDGARVYLGLKQKGILVRHFGAAGLSEYVRITIGTTEENDALLGVMRQLV